MGGQSRRGRSTLAHGSLCRDDIDRWDPLEQGCRSTSRPCCGPAHQLFVLELERASRSQLPVPITDERNGLLRSGLLQYSDADELAVLPPSAVASVGPNGGNRYRKCDDPKRLSDNLSNPGLHQPIRVFAIPIQLSSDCMDRFLVSTSHKIIELLVRHTSTRYDCRLVPRVVGP